MEYKYKADSIKQPKMKLKQQTTKESVDGNGEFKKSEKTSVFSGREREPNYVKMYLADIEIIHRLPKNSGNILSELLKNMNYESEITVNTLMKKRICEKLNIKNDRTINNALSEMVKKDVLQRSARGVYVVNPYLIAKGDWQDIKGLRVEYKKNGERKVTPLSKEE